MRKTTNSNHSGKRGLLIALCIVLSILLLLLTGVAVLLSVWNNYKGKINYVEHKGVKESELYQQMREDGELLEDDDEIINILLIGQDSWSGQGRQRSDSMILCTVNLHTDTFTMTSFMRDMYVEIPGYSANKLNAAYQMGGMELLDLSLLLNFGIVVDYNIEIDFEGFMNAVDIVGGIDMELTQAEADYLNARGNWDIDNSTAGQWNLKAGKNHLTGEQALAYCRTRYVGNADFGRTERQRKVLTELINECKTLSVREIDGLLKEILPLLTTDMSSEQIDKYILEILPMLPNLKTNQMRVPADGAYYDDTVNGMSVLIPDLEKNKELLRQMLHK